MLTITELEKRRQYNYDSSMNLDSMTNRQNINYPVNKLFLNDNMDVEKLREQIKKYCLDYFIKTSSNITLLGLCFENEEDYNELNKAMNFQKVNNLNNTNQLLTFI